MWQEKSQYYTTISAAINSAVLYDADDKVQSFATTSDVKSHKADAKWASLTKIIQQIDFSNQTVAICSYNQTAHPANIETIKYFSRESMGCFTKHWCFLGFYENWTW